MADDCRMTCASRRKFITHMSGAMLAALVGMEAAGEAAERVYAVGEVAGIAVAPTSKSYPLPSGDGVNIDKAMQVILVRYQGKVIAFNLACPHENTALRWKQGSGKFECPKHNSRYTPEGKFIDGRATRNMDRLHLTRDGNTVVADLTNIIKSDEQPAEWAAAAIAV
jgi:nitrite reductase/ring-hydroxylating ferredoxin subunit